MHRRFLVLALATASTGLVFTGCGDKVIDSGKAEKLVRKNLALKGVTASQLKSVKCPSNVKVKVGINYTCVATSTKGQKANITFKVLDTKGNVSPPTFSGG